MTWTEKITMTTREYLERLAQKGYTVISPDVMTVQDVLVLYEQLDSLRDSLRDANEGAKLLHSLATGGEQSVLSRLDNGVDVQDAERWQDDFLPCGHSSKHLGGFGGCNPNGSCMLCEEKKRDESGLSEANELHRELLGQS